MFVRTSFLPYALERFSMVKIYWAGMSFRSVLVAAEFSHDWRRCTRSWFPGRAPGTPSPSSPHQGSWTRLSGLSGAPAFTSTCTQVDPIVQAMKRGADHGRGRLEVAGVIW